jgi:hypothetical protein
VGSSRLRFGLLPCTCVRGPTGDRIVEHVDLAVAAAVEDLLQRVPRTVCPRVANGLQSASQQH